MDISREYEKFVWQNAVLRGNFGGDASHLYWIIQLLASVNILVASIASIGGI